MITKHRVRANGIDFTYLACGEGPLALCLHGFPDTPHSYRFLMEDLAAAGYRAVAPFMRGYAPTSIPADGRYDTASLGADVAALHEALGGDERAVLIGHDWGACVAYCGASREPALWRKLVGLSVPPLAVFAKMIVPYDQLKRSFYFWFFQMAVSDSIVFANNLEFIERLWKDWSPGFDGSKELEHVRASLGHLENLQAALGYYRGLFSADGFATGAWMAHQTAVWGRPLKHPTLYLHGQNDGCIVLSNQLISEVPACFGQGSQAEVVPELGHFLLLEDPKAVNDRILAFLGEAPGSKR